MKQTTLILLFILGIIGKPNAQTVSTYAGNGNTGNTDGPRDSAEFNGPEQLAYDKKGNLLIVDGSSHTIRLIDKNGMVSTFAGTGVAGFNNGHRSVAQFNFPLGIIVDNDNNIFIGDQLNNVIRKIDTNGMVTTFAGNGNEGFQDGADSIAEFSLPGYLCFDDSMNLYVTEGGGANHTIRKISPKGFVTTLAGSDSIGYKNGPSKEALFNIPIAITFSKSQNAFYVSDRGNSAIRKISRDGMVTTYAGGNGLGHNDGPRQQAKFTNQKGIISDEIGNLYIAGRMDYTIRKIDTSGIVSTIAGIPGISSHQDGPIADALFVRPIALLLTPENKLLISDWGGDRIRLYDPNGKVGLKETGANKNAVLLYPNPAAETIGIQSEQKIISIKLFNAMGQLQKNNTSFDLTGNQINITSLPIGVYWIQIETKEGMQLEHFIKK